MIAVKVGMYKNGVPWTGYREEVQGFWKPGSVHSNTFRVLGRNIGFAERQMYDLARVALDSIKQRVARGIGSDDAPMAGLKKGYAIWKTKHGLGNKRNLVVTGGMLDSFQIRSVSATEARMDITSRDGRMKARENERRTPWFGWSASDVKAIIAKAQTLWGSAMRDFALQMQGRSAQGSFRTASPVWMDPLGLRAGTLGATTAGVQAIPVRVSAAKSRPRRRRAA